MLDGFFKLDKAFIEKLQGLKIDGKEVPVLYINPEREVKEAEYPSIAIYRAGIYQNLRRWNNQTYYDNYVNKNGKPHLVDVRQAPIPYDIYYGVRLFYKYQRDGAVLSMHLNSVLKRGAYLTVDKVPYDIEFLSYRNPDITYKDFGEKKENEVTEFVEQYLYVVEAELDIGVRTTKTLVQEVVPEVGTKDL